MTLVSLLGAVVRPLGVDRSYQLPFRDPGLPHEVLDPGWAAPEAVALFERLVAMLEKPALAHAASYWPGDRVA